MELLNIFDRTFNSDCSIRIFIDSENNPWFNGKQVAKALEYRDPNKALQDHISPVYKSNLSELYQNIGLGELPIPILTHNEGISIYINEAGLYSLIFSCKLTIAEKFRNWVFSEVLPAIRKAGEYKKEEFEKLKSELSKTQGELTDLKEDHYKLVQNHKRIIYKKKQHTMQVGKCFYINVNADDEIETEDDTFSIKFGVTTNLNVRQSSYKTYYTPKFVLVIYTLQNKLLEDSFKQRYKSLLEKHDGDERINNGTIAILEDMKEFALSFVKMLNMDYTFVQDDKIIDQNGAVVDDFYSQEIASKKEYTKKEPKIVSEKICPKCSINKPAHDFNKDTTHSDKLRSMCKDCEKKYKQSYKEKKEAQILENPPTDLNCSNCKETKDVSKFLKHLYTKSGYTTECLECIKKKRNEMRRNDTSKYECDGCKKSYSRKDQLVRHLKSCT
jgi:prophage antirepressor-like protein